VRIRCDAPAATPALATPVLNLQLEAADRKLRDYLVDFDRSGERTLVLPEPASERAFVDFPNAEASYRSKAALQTFDYGRVVALNIRWMRPPGPEVRCELTGVEAVTEDAIPLRDLEVRIAGASITFARPLSPGDYLEWWGTGPVKQFDRNGFMLAEIPLGRPAPELPAGPIRIAIDGSGARAARLTTITIGEPLES
jgi:hypothetical protein